MIISKTVKQKVSSSNFSYLKELGYELKPLTAPRWGGVCEVIDVKVEHLKPNSNTRVDCKCDICGTSFTKKFSARLDLCNKCRTRETGLGNTNGSGNKGKTIEKMKGENHPRWNPNKSEYAAYASKVRAVTYACKEEWMKLENSDKLGLCGVEGAYQLDHKVSVAYGFYNHIPAEIIGQLDNLEIITWEENRSKGKTSSADLWDLLK